MRIVNRTILFTEACPLACRYCHLESHEGYHKMAPFDEQRVLDEVAKFDKMDDPKEAITILTLTGGEPFIAWDLIKQIMEQYGNRFVYEFNTSGYLLTEEHLEFLSHYNTRFVLSVDGDYRLTNYLRPVRNSKYHVGYMKQLEKILPTLLFYFPKTPFRMIINPRYVDTVYDQYLFAERMGFREVTFVLDFNTRAYDLRRGQRAWNQEDTEILRQQFVKIAEEMLAGLDRGLWRPMVLEFEKVIKVLMKGTDRFDPRKDLQCKLADGRTITTMYGTNGHCMDNDFPDREVVLQMMEDEYKACGGKCPIDPQCPAFNYCLRTFCPKNAYTQHGKFLMFEHLECALSQAAFEAALLLMYNYNEHGANNPFFNAYLRKLIGGEGNGS